MRKINLILNHIMPLLTMTFTKIFNVMRKLSCKAFRCVYLINDFSFLFLVEHYHYFSELRLNFKNLT